MASPDNSTHGQCVQIAASPGFTKTFAMAVLPKLDDFAAGLDLAVLRPIVVREKSRPSPRAQVREGFETSFLDVFLCAVILEIQVSTFIHRSFSYLIIFEVVRLYRMLKPHESDLMSEETGVSGENPRSQLRSTENSVHI